MAADTAAGSPERLGAIAYDLTVEANLGGGEFLYQEQAANQPQISVTPRQTPPAVLAVLNGPDPSSTAAHLQPANYNVQPADYNVQPASHTPIQGSNYNQGGFVLQGTGAILAGVHLTVR